MFLSNNSCFFAQEIFDEGKKKSKYRISCFIKERVIYASTCDFKKVILVGICISRPRPWP